MLFLRNSPSTGPNLYHGAGVTTDKVDNPKIKGKEWKISQQCKNRVSTSVIEWVGYCILFLLRTGCPWRKESWNPNAAEMHGLNAGLKSFQSLLACRADPKPDLSWHSLSTKHSSCTWTNPIKAIGFAETLQAARLPFRACHAAPHPTPKAMTKMQNYAIHSRLASTSCKVQLILCSSILLKSFINNQCERGSRPMSPKRSEAQQAIYQTDQNLKVVDNFIQSNCFPGPATSIKKKKKRALS